MQTATAPAAPGLSGVFEGLGDYLASVKAGQPDTIELLRAVAGLEKLPLAPTPYTVIYRKEHVRLLRYEPKVRRFRTPVLFAYSLINRYYILDFLPGRSLIAFLLDQGFPVYCIDWGTAGRQQQELGWGDYVDRLLHRCVRRTLQDAGADNLSLYGYCMGGTMALAYTALHPEGVRNFVAQAVPVDFAEGGVLRRWTDPRFFDADALVDAHGNVPVDIMDSAFRFMDPIGSAQKWRSFFQKLDDEKFTTLFLSMERWAGDNVPFPGELYRQYIRDCYQTNRFMKGEMRIDDRRVDLAQVRCPLLNVIAEKDTLVPPPASEVLNGLVGSDDTATLRFPCGHIGLASSSKAPKEFWPRIGAWLAEHSEALPKA